MKFISSLGMRKIDRLATEKFAIPSLILMENAGRSVADEVEKMFTKKEIKVIVLCGYGNNGGDGFVTARHLINRGYNIRVYLVGEQKKKSDDTKINFDILNKMKVRIKKIRNQSQMETLIRNIKKFDLIIDAIFGIGLKGRINEFYYNLFRKLNNSNIPVLSIDIPSGLNADSGIASPIAIKAKETVTMGMVKKGFLNPLAKKYLGKLVVADISLPKQLR